MKSLPFKEEEKKIVLFIAKVLGLYLLWYLVYDLWIFPDGKLDTWLSEHVAWAASLLLSLFGFPSYAEGVAVLVNGRPTVLIGNPCNGMVLFGIFTGFIIAFPGLVKRKVVFIVIGLMAIYLVNVLRVVALALNHIYSYGTVSFNHHYTFTFAVYGCIFLLWMYWVKRGAGPALTWGSGHDKS
jgi:exosortase family protein XrtF